MLDLLFGWSRQSIIADLGGTVVLAVLLAHVARLHLLVCLRRQAVIADLERAILLAVVLPHVTRLERAILLANIARLRLLLCFWRQPVIADLERAILLAVVLPHVTRLERAVFLANVARLRRTVFLLDVDAEQHVGQRAVVQADALRLPKDVIHPLQTRRAAGQVKHAIQHINLAIVQTLSKDIVEASIVVQHQSVVTAILYLGSRHADGLSMYWGDAVQR
jgi:hypothetical protein